jgi:hypothetical protein
MARKHPKRTGGTFLLLHHHMLRHKSFGSLSANAAKLFIEVAIEYNGKNNGDLSATFNTLKMRGFKSKGTLDRALKELMNKGFIQKTRQGGKNKCCLYGLTVFKLDECDGKMDVSPTKVASMLWKKNDIPTPTQSTTTPDEGQ